MSTGRHLAALPPPPSGDRHGCEWWVLAREGARSLSLWESGTDRYERRYPRERHDMDDARRQLARLAPAAAD